MYNCASMYVGLCEILIFGPLLPVLMDQSYFMTVVPPLRLKEKKRLEFPFYECDSEKSHQRLDQTHATKHFVNSSLRSDL
jgi:hypothetical protein